VCAICYSGRMARRGGVLGGWNSTLAQTIASSLTGAIISRLSGLYSRA
jgi:hypothetical protein